MTLIVVRYIPSSTYFTVVIVQSISYFAGRTIIHILTNLTIENIAWDTLIIFQSIIFEAYTTDVG
jgi:hypothetical protein